MDPNTKVSTPEFFSCCEGARRIQDPNTTELFGYMCPVHGARNRPGYEVRFDRQVAADEDHARSILAHMGALPTTDASEANTAKVELAMAGAAKMVENAFTVAQARSLGAMFDALVEIAIEENDAGGIGRAKRAMVAALKKLATSKGNFELGEVRDTLYTDTAPPVRA